LNAADIYKRAEAAATIAGEGPGCLWAGTMTQIRGKNGAGGRPTSFLVAHAAVDCNCWCAGKKGQHPAGRAGPRDREIRRGNDRKSPTKGGLFRTIGRRRPKLEPEIAGSWRRGATREGVFGSAGFRSAGWIRGLVRLEVTLRPRGGSEFFAFFRLRPLAGEGGQGRRALKAAVTISPEIPGQQQEWRFYEMAPAGLGYGLKHRTSPA